MAKIEIKKCDICGDEERSDATPKYWACYHSGNIIINFKNAPNIQADFSKDCLCFVCSENLKNIIVDGIKLLMKNRSNPKDRKDE